MKLRITAVCCALLTLAFAQETKPIPPVTDKEQTEFLKKHDKALQLTSQAAYQNGVAAQNDVNRMIVSLYVDRKVCNAAVGIQCQAGQQEATLCFGPGAGLCADVPEMTLEFKVNPKPQPEPAKTPTPTEPAKK
jgi:hypothetical protein